jgi:ABC-2 type transport system permease protein
VGLARRDHADRSVEFWLSLPIAHSRSLLLPMAVHLVLVPLAALVVGLFTGPLLAGVLLARTHTVADWWALPWLDVAQGALVVLARAVAGWPLMVLWLAPLVVLAMLAFAWLRRWGLVVLAVALGLGLSPLGTVLGYPVVQDTLQALGEGAMGALFNGAHQELHGEADAVVQHSIRQAPAWLVEDLAGSLKSLASPVFLGGQLFAALCLYGLVQWRRRGASTAV